MSLALWKHVSHCDPRLGYIIILHPHPSPQEKISRGHPFQPPADAPSSFALTVHSRVLCISGLRFGEYLDLQQQEFLK
jgi:hypothetical protein